ncbi:MAG: pyrroline-5-carboxylate reductase [Chloroflexi bacterium]|nr:MAG: pyrroline-5-carboxylate reductase [Chloroflexota bacterium]MBL1194435.1 pyrroline-5-carboxylate reductase [Chloroflexota bacterium]NOH11723.1 pyrroline-5-carboxylate reductase [Chloroflexota bacterium]
MDLFTNKTITFIGPGSMAEAMIAGLLRKELAPAGNLIASGPRTERVEQLQAKYGLTPMTDNTAAVDKADVVVLAVKPQQLGKVMQGIKGHVDKDALIVSIIAGATIKSISSGLGCEAVLRAMPNTPARIGEGITVWTAAETVSDEQHEMGRSLLTALGDEVFVEEEDFLDKATALSGTGPAYVYLFMEAMVDAGVHLGFSRRIAEQLVVQTVRGSVDYYEKNEDERHLSRLRNQVTSPGGTSAEAIYFLEKAGFRTAISRAIWAAYERSVQLGSGSDRKNLK